MDVSDSSELNEIQRLQFSDKTEAERRLLVFLENIGAGPIARVELNPKPESLNSVNGFITFAGGERYFFKSHTEEREALEGYYNEEVLSDAGYAVVQPEMVRTIPGQQIALYEVISLPTLFDLVKEEEDLLIERGSLSERSETLIRAQHQLDRQIFTIYETTLEQTPAQVHAHAPIHQLFYHRIKPQGRYDLYYENATLELEEQFVPYAELANARWRINGVDYHESLSELVENARRLLVPDHGAVPTVIGHGDAHNGNVFYDATSESLLYFDPAFAGRHHPLLDLTKPLFHNVFARWMYFPAEATEEIDIRWRIDKDLVEVEHSFYPSALREEFLNSKLAYVLQPLTALLRSKGLLEPQWQNYLRAALFCCPLLTVNLAAEYEPVGRLAERYSAQVKMLGFCMAIEIAASQWSGTSKMRRLIDPIFGIG